MRAIVREQQQDHPGYEEVCRRFLADQKDFSEDKSEEKQELQEDIRMMIKYDAKKK